jgi:hypothetical protein
MLSGIMLNALMLSILFVFIVILNVIKGNGIMLSVIILSVIVLNVAAPFFCLSRVTDHFGDQIKIAITCSKRHSYKTQSTQHWQC